MHLISTAPIPLGYRHKLIGPNFFRIYESMVLGFIYLNFKFAPYKPATCWRIWESGQ